MEKAENPRDGQSRRRQRRVATRSGVVQNDGSRLHLAPHPRLMHSVAPGSPPEGDAKSSVLLRGAANGFGGRRQVASSTSHERSQAGVPGIGVKLALFELEHFL